MTMIQEGLVGVFDILGYQNIIDNNDIEKIFKIVSEKLNNLPKNVKDTIEKLIQDKETRNYFIKEMKNFSWLVISDTILLTLPFDPNISSSDRVLNWIYFLLLSAMLLRLSFDEGLPLRGAVDLGNFFIDGNCFAGKPIVGAYRFANNLQISGCALTTNVKKVLEKDLDNVSAELRDNIINHLLFMYLVPLKDGKEEKLLIVNWLKPLDDWEKTPDDIRQYVVDKFHAHNKDVHRKAFVKLENTEIILRYSLNRNRILDNLH